MAQMDTYDPPFPWFGGKSRVADKVWQALGDPPNYVEPFAGSAAVLMLRPKIGKVETINDADGFVANFWRALQHDPEQVAFHADNPVNECDLHARHLWLVARREQLTDRLCGDPDYFDAKIAGWWVWGQSCWISGGWCCVEGPWTSENGMMVKGQPGCGVHRTRPDLGRGRGVHRKSIGSLVAYMRALADRLRRVRVCCGDWSRVCGPSATVLHGVTGVFLDPPYSGAATRDERVYAVDCLKVAHEVREWAIEHGNDPRMRIVLAGYEGEHDMPANWRVVAWKANGGFANRSDHSQAKQNKRRERLWLSPHCVRFEMSPGMMF